MKRKWFRLLVAVPLIAILCITNIYEDPANLFHNDNKSIAEALLSGYAAYVGSGNWDERGVKLYTIENMPKHVNCITVGPSLSMGIRKTDVGTESYYNLSVSAFNLYDFMAWLALLQIHGVTFDRMIICVDSYFFDDNKNADGSRNPDMMPYARYMLAFLDGEDPSPVFDNHSFDKIRLLIEQAFSITYFQASCDQIRSNNSYILPEKRWGIVDSDTEKLAHYLPDGSWVYTSEYQAHTVDYVVKHSNDYNIKKQFCYGKHISEQGKKYFVKILDYLQSNNVVIEFFYCPLAPTLWDRIYSGENADHYYILDEIEDFTRKIAAERNIKTTGTYNPHTVGVTDDDFLDSRHMRHERLSNYFDFKE